MLITTLMAFALRLHVLVDTPIFRRMYATMDIFPVNLFWNYMISQICVHGTFFIIIVDNTYQCRMC